jgi:hypothetical protein
VKNVLLDKTSHVSVAFDAGYRLQGDRNVSSSRFPREAVGLIKRGLKDMPETIHLVQERGYFWVDITGISDSR